MAQISRLSSETTFELFKIALGIRIYVMRIQLEARRILNYTSRKECFSPCYGLISSPSSPVTWPSLIPLA